MSVHTFAFIMARNTWGSHKERKRQRPPLHSSLNLRGNSTGDSMGSEEEEVHQKTEKSLKKFTQKEMEQLKTNKRPKSKEL